MSLNSGKLLRKQNKMDTLFGAILATVFLTLGVNFSSASTCPIPSGCSGYTFSGASSAWLGNKSRTVASFPGFHGFPASTPVEPQQPDGSVVLENSVWSKTVPTDWQGWTHCPKGMYARGQQYHNFAPSGGPIFSYGILCQTPGGNEQDRLVLLRMGGTKTPDGRDWGVCTGTIVGFQLQKKSVTHATTEVEVHCSTPVPQENIALLRSPIVGKDWTESRFCGKYQAMCGLRVTFLQNDKPEAKGMHNMQIKCCHVPDPLKDCVPTEERLYIRTCDSFYSVWGLRCEFESKIGLGLHQNGEEEEREIIFYSSIGYDYFSVYEGMRKKIISKLAAKPIPSSQRYNWSEVDCRVEDHELVQLSQVCVKPFQKVKLYQIVGRCGNFLVRSNRFMKVVNDYREPTEYFDL